MGLQISLHGDAPVTSDHHPGRQYLPKQTLVIQEESRKRAPGTLAEFYSAIPSNVKFRTDEPPNLYWWPDVEFVPHSEQSVFTSPGAFLSRPGFTDIIAHSKTHGMLYHTTFTSTPEVNIIKGTSTMVFPNIAMHPGGTILTYAAGSNIVMMNPDTKWRIKRDNDVRMNNFRVMAISPCGSYVAAMSRCSRVVELETFLIEWSMLLKQSQINCHTVCPGFVTSLQVAARFQCCFSPDSQFIVCASSVGQLFAVRRHGLQHHLALIPGLFQWPDVRISNERCVDFDPRYMHKYLAFCDHQGVVYFCDIDSGSIDSDLDLEIDSAVQSLKYSPSGHCFSVAVADGSIRVYSTDQFELIHTLDATAGLPDAALMKPIDGRYPVWIRQSFASTGNLLATSATDGIIRVWQLAPDLSLQQLCRRVILQHLPMRAIVKLPLPAKIIAYLLQWPEL